MKPTDIEEMTNIVRQLTPENQAYIMTMVRVAGAAESNVKSALEKEAARAEGETNAAKTAL